MITDGTRATPAQPLTRLTLTRGSRRTLDLPTHIMRPHASPVDFATVSKAERWELVHGLIRALHAGPVGSGLAAPMVGVGLRVVVSTAGEEPMVMINPRVVSTQGPDNEREESNLSLPGLRAPVVRPDSVTVEWQTVNTGRQESASFQGWQARVLMHEIEILDGRLFIDHASAPALGSWSPPEPRAQRAASAVFGEEPAKLPGADPLSLVTLPPSLHKLESVLTRPAEEVDIDALAPGHLRCLVEAMLRLQYEERGVGLAAPQVGLGLRLVVIDSGESRPVVLINPQIVDREDSEEVATEGCLSVPGWRGEVSRSLGVKVATRTVAGEAVELAFTGYEARVVQHEIDHLDGVLFTTRMHQAEQLSVSDPDAAAQDLVTALKRREAERSRNSANRANPGRSSAKRAGKRRR
jgi:peptide deformylase